MLTKLLQLVIGTVLTLSGLRPGQAAEAPVTGAMLASPDGRWHVYERRVEHGIQLWIHDMTGSAHQALVRLPGDNRNAAWSPDSLFVAFCATFHGRRFVTVTDLTGHSWLVAEINGACNTPVWSPDASQLAFSSQTKAGDSDVYVASAGGTLHQNLTRSHDRNEVVRAWLPETTQPEIQVLPVE